ncbi:MAG: DUF2892 domain-containing protein [Bacteroidota bacterium]
MGHLDRTFRFVAALLVAILYVTGLISGTVALVLGVVSVAFFLTSFIGMCPIYLPFGWSTRGQQG